MCGNRLERCGHTFSSQHCQLSHSSQFRLHAGLPLRGCTAPLLAWERGEQPNPVPGPPNPAPAIPLLDIVLFKTRRFASAFFVSESEVVSQYETSVLLAVQVFSINFYNIHIRMI